MGHCLGATNTAASGTYAAVNTAYGLCNPGDVLKIPSDTQTWGSTLAVSVANLWIIGAGSNNTVITGTNLFNVSASGVRISSMKLIGSQPPPDINSYWTVYLQNNITGFRIDRCHFSGGGRTVYCGGLAGTGYAWGVIDHCTFQDNNVAVGIHGANNYSAFSQQPGTTNCVVMENDSFTVGAAGGSFNYQGENFYHQWGGRSIIRVCTIDDSANPSFDAFLDAHGNTGYLPNSGHEQGTCIVECCTNTFIGSPYSCLANLRGGSQVWHDNTITSSSPPGDTFRLSEEEEYRQDLFGGPGPPWGPTSNIRTIDGSNPGGWPAQQQITNSFFWNNTMNSSPVNPTLILGNYNGGSYNYYMVMTGYIILERDYFIHAPASTNNYYPYTPLVYPHPLVTAQDGGGGGGGGVHVSAAGNLRITGSINIP